MFDGLKADKNLRIYTYFVFLIFFIIDVKIILGVLLIVKTLFLFICTSIFLGFVFFNHRLKFLVNVVQ